MSRLRGVRLQGVRAPTSLNASLMMTNVLKVNTVSILMVSFDGLITEMLSLILSSTPPRAVLRAYAAEGVSVMMSIEERRSQSLDASEHVTPQASHRPACLTAITVVTPVIKQKTQRDSLSPSPSVTTEELRSTHLIFELEISLTEVVLIIFKMTHHLLIYRVIRSPLCELRAW